MADWQKMKVLLMFMFGDLLDDHRKLPLNENEGNSHDEDEEIIQAISLMIQQLNERVPGVRIPGYFETVVPRYSDKTFKSHFRLRRTSLERLCQFIAPSKYLQKKQTGGRPSIPLEKQVCIYLWYSASQEPLRSISDR